MSGETASVESETEDSTGTSVLDLWQKWYDIVGLAGIMVFMLWVRAKSWKQFVRGDQVLFAGNDAYYHYREIRYVTEHWPSTMPFDPWSAFPYGTEQGQFGTLFDQLVATVALIVGLGNPSEHTVKMVTLFAPPVLGALVALPVYYMGRRMYNRVTGLFAALLLAVMPGTFLRRSTVGFADHQVAEVLFLALAMLALMVAFSVSESELPVYEQVLDRDWDGLKRPVGFAALAGVAAVLYMWVWPPGIILVGILGIFFTVGLSSDYLRGRSPEHVALVGIVSMATTAVLLLPLLDTFGTETTKLSFLHVFLSVAVMVWCLFLAALARLWDDWDVSSIAYPVTVVGLLGLGLLVIWVLLGGIYEIVGWVAWIAVVGGLAAYWSGKDLSRAAYPVVVLWIVVFGLLAIRLLLPGVFGTLVSNATRSFGFGQSATSLTIAEAQPTPGVDPFNLGTLNEYFFREYGLAYVVALLSLGWLAVYTYYTDYRSELVLLVVWTVLTWLMALTQRRFHYYLVIPVVLLTAWTFGRVIEMTGTPSVTDRIGDVKPYQVLTILAVLLLIFAPLLPPLAAASFSESRQSGTPQFVVDAGRTRPSGTVWASTGEWMQSNTPDQGMDYYGEFEQTGDFDYPDSAYGVMSWWDYGHWITVLNEQMPHANPFQENAKSASSFLQADTERRANAILDAIPGNRGLTGRFGNMTTDEIAAAAEENPPDEEDIRYVMIDDQTAAGKFLAVRQWVTPPNITSPRQYLTSVQYQIQLQRGRAPVNRSLGVASSFYQDTILYELYYENGDGLSHYRLVHASDSYSLVGGFITNGRVRTLNSFRLAGNGWSQQLAGLERNLTRADRSRPGRPRQALRLPGGTFVYNGSIESSLKVFEQVSGATITGNVENGSAGMPVVVELDLQTGPGRPITYRQQVTTGPGGSFQVTVPYATNDVVGPSDGGTDTNVTAVGNYSLYVGASKSRIELFSSLGADMSGFVSAQFNVSEEALYTEGQVDVDLGSVERPQSQSNDGNQSDGRLLGDRPTSLDGDALTTGETTPAVTVPVGARGH